MADEKKTLPINAKQAHDIAVTKCNKEDALDPIFTAIRKAADSGDCEIDVKIEMTGCAAYLRTQGYTVETKSKGQFTISW